VAPSASLLAGTAANGKRREQRGLRKAVVLIGLAKLAMGANPDGTDEPGTSHVAIQYRRSLRET